MNDVIVGTSSDLRVEKKHVLERKNTTLCNVSQ